MKPLYHLTVTTGHVHESARSEIAQHAIDKPLPVIDNEYGEFPGVGLAVDLYRPLDEVTRRPQDGAIIFHIQSLDGKSIYVVGFGAWNETMSEATWEAVREQARVAKVLGPIPADPPRVPWLAVMLTINIIELDKDRTLLLGDMERCLFWAAVEASGS